MEFDKLKEYLDGWAYGKNVDDVGDYLEEAGCRRYDEGYDDGGDAEDEYIMYMAYEVGKNNVILYYSNIDNLVTYIEYR